VTVIVRGALDECRHRLGVGHVERDTRYPARRARRQCVGGRLRSGLVDVGQDHRGAAPRQCARHCFADPRRRPGDDGHTSLGSGCRPPRGEPRPGMRIGSRRRWRWHGHGHGAATPTVTPMVATEGGAVPWLSWVGANGPTGAISMLSSCRVGRRRGAGVADRGRVRTSREGGGHGPVVVREARGSGPGPDGARPRRRRGRGQRRAGAGQPFRVPRWGIALAPALGAQDLAGVEALLDTWRRGAVVAGSSAGAMVLTDPMVDPRGGALTVGWAWWRNWR